MLSAETRLQGDLMRAVSVNIVSFNKVSFNILFSTLVVCLYVASVDVFAVDIIKSPNDDRAYQYFQLANQLQVLLVSDASIDKAAAALDVGVGSGDDPQARPGLAHFLEHMLFLGTEKYPGADEYQNYLSEHGGSHNAYTALENTNYYFDVDPNYLDPMLDRFAQFFAAPLFAPEYVDRERNAVHSEYTSKLKDDGRRVLDVYREVINSDHPLAKFSVGNLSTLSNDDGEMLRNDLLAFYQQHYNAKQMTLVVIGRESLADLRKMVEPRFAAIVNHESSEQHAATENPPLFEPGRLPLKLYIKPEQEQRYLSLLFPIPTIDPYYREKPTYYLGNLIGDEGKGSLLALLKSLNWAEALSAGSFFANSDDAFFQINIRLTEEGLQQTGQIVALTFALINHIEKSGMEQWRFDELKKLSEIDFRFQEKQAAIVTASSLANNLHYYAPEDVLRGDQLIQHYDPSLLRNFLSYLTPENVLMVVNAPEVQTDKITHYYDVPYKVKKLDKFAAPIPDLVAQLNLPPVNDFIPKTLALKPIPPSAKKNSPTTDGNVTAVTVPELLKDASRVRVWYKQDRVFNVPRANTFLRIRSPLASQSIQGAVMMELYVELIDDLLNEYTYPASIAGLQFSLEANSRGFDLSVDGYDDGQDRLLQRIIMELRKPHFESKRFSTVKTELMRRWQNADKQPPYVQLLQELPSLLFDPMWDQAAMLEALRSVTFENVTGFAKNVYVDSHADMLFYGNLTRKEAAKMSAQIEIDLLGAMGSTKIAPARVVRLHDDKHEPLVTLPVEHNDKALLLYLQGADDSLQEAANTLLLQQIIRSPFFNELRTERQLGYIVFATSLTLKDVPGTLLVVQSPTATIDTLVDEVHGFLQRFADQLPVELELHKQAVLTQLRESPQNLNEQGERYWQEILAEALKFDRRDKLIATVDGISAEAFNKYLGTVLTDNPRLLWLVSLSSENPSQDGKISTISDWTAYRSERQSYIYP